MRRRVIFAVLPLAVAALLGIQLLVAQTSRGLPDRADSFTDPDSEPRKAGQADAFVLGAAHLPGLNDTVWRTSLEVCNFSESVMDFDLSFLARGEDNRDPDTSTVQTEPGECERFEDVLLTLFGLEDAAGAIRVESSGDGLVAMARTYNDTPNGTFGSAQRTIPGGDAISFGAFAALTHLSQSANDATGFRSNLELLNTTDGLLTVEVHLYLADGTFLDVLSVYLDPWESNQLTRLFRHVTDEDVDDGYAVVRTKTPGGSFLAAASLIDNRSGDGISIAAEPLPGSSWQEPQNLGPVINSTSNDWYPVPARDGSFMIITSDRPGGYGSCDLYISRWEEGQWQAPQNLGPNVNTSGCDGAPYLSPDDQTLYFVSVTTQGAGSVYRCPLTDGLPGAREKLEPPINRASLDCCPVISSDGNTMFICSDRTGGYGNLDVWVSRRVNGVWQEPVNLGDHVNTPWNDSPRWLSDDGTTLIIDSNRPDGWGGADLWYTRWDGQTASAPVNLGTPINSNAAEWGPGFLGNAGEIGGTIFFGSGRSGGHGGWDIWSSVHRGGDRAATCWGPERRALPAPPQDDGCACAGRQ